MTLRHKFLLIALLLTAGPCAQATDVVHHHMQIALTPSDGGIAVQDRIEIPADRNSWVFTLHGDLNPAVTRGNASLRLLGRAGDLERFSIDFEAGERSATLSYSGTIRHEFNHIRESPGRSRAWTRGTISGDGVFLDANSGWYPRFEHSLQTFELRVELPEGWLAVSQGRGPDAQAGGGKVQVSWRERQPQDDIYLVAGPFHLYETAAPVATAQVYLREPDEPLARQYLDATAEYLGLYSQLIGPYPYAKFALVENFWATGYGMPSFTLLGSRVIRLPFILHSSYPHEILHNWWGNAVYVDYAGGNWSEALTNYLADYLLKEQAGQGPHHRRDTLQRYADYVRQGQDFPLRDFRARHSGASQAIGYGKGMMFFHMLRRKLGDRDFVEGLRNFYADNLFGSAGFLELQRAFEQTSGQELGDFFHQWTTRTGAPTLALENLSLPPQAGGYAIRGKLRQTQDGEAFPLEVPLVVHVEHTQPLVTVLRMEQKELPFSLRTGTRPLQLAVDPTFDLFRTLVTGESPPTLSRLFGADRGLIVWPGAANQELRRAYRRLAEAWTQGYPGWRASSDAELERLPDDRPTWLLGWKNRFLPEFLAHQRAIAVDANDATVAFAGNTLTRGDHSLALVRPQSLQGQTVAWLAAQGAEAVPGLARKLPHYGKYSYLAFTGESPDNRVKGQWAVSSSALTQPLAGQQPIPVVLPEPRLSDLAEP